MDPVGDGEYTPYSQKSMLTLMFLVCVEMIVGNVLLLIVVLKNKHFGNKSTTNFLIASLAISDLIVGVIVVPPNIIWEIFGEWKFGHIFCEVWQTIDVFVATVSLLNVSAISMDRYLAISDPFGYPLKMTKRRVLLLIAAIWIVAALVTFPQMVYDLATVTEYKETKCEFIFANPPYAVFLTTTTFFIPLLIISVVNYRTYKIALIQIQRVYKETKPTQVAKDVENSNGVKTPSKSRFSPVTKKQLRLTRSIVVVVFVFIVCWTPYFIAYSIFSFCHKCLPDTGVPFEVAVWLAWFNSGLNPIVYTISSKCFRKLFFATLMCRSTPVTN